MFLSVILNFSVNMSGNESDECTENSSMIILVLKTSESYFEYICNIVSTSKELAVKLNFSNSSWKLLNAFFNQLF